MISEADQKCYLVSAAPPAKLQYFGGQIDGATAFYCDWRKGTPLTHVEAQRVKAELEQTFSQRHEQFQIVRLDEVDKPFVIKLQMDNSKPEYMVRDTPLTFSLSIGRAHRFRDEDEAREYMACNEMYGMDEISIVASYS